MIEIRGDKSVDKGKIFADQMTYFKPLVVLDITLLLPDLIPTATEFVISSIQKQAFIQEELKSVMPTLKHK